MSLDLDFTLIFQRANEFLGALWPIVALAAGVGFAIYLGRMVINIFRSGFLS
jgi:hypothetical protein